MHEALELRDGDKENYHGKGVSKAVNNINKTISPALVKANLEVTQQKEIDEFMIKLDGTDNKSKFGANALLGVSLAVCKAGAAKRGVPLYKHIADLAGNKNLVLPVPAFNVINGGSHAGNKLAMQVIIYNQLTFLKKHGFINSIFIRRHSLFQCVFRIFLGLIFRCFQCFKYS